MPIDVLVYLRRGNPSCIMAQDFIHHRVHGYDYLFVGLLGLYFQVPLPIAHVELVGLQAGVIADTEPRVASNHEEVAAQCNALWVGRQIKGALDSGCN